jgi:putative oxidoreductase
MNLVEKYNQLSKSLGSLKDIPLLLMRLVLAYGFYGTGIMKWKNLDNVAEWFGSLGIPFPVVNTYLAASSEIAGVILLILGLGTRIIAVPLMFTMLIAIITVHIGNGFEAGNNGFEIPLYYFLMLLGLMVNGSGKISLDFLISRMRKNA